MFFAGSWANPSPLLTGNDEEYLAARALASSLSQTNRELTHNFKGLSQAYEELKVEGRRQEEELHQTQDALDKLKEKMRGLRESLAAVSTEKDKAIEAANSSANLIAKKDAQISKLSAMVNAARSSRAALSAERNKWKTLFHRKFLRFAYCFLCLRHLGPDRALGVCRAAVRLPEDGGVRGCGHAWG